MPITFDRDPERDLTTFTISVVVTFDEFIDVLNDYGRTGPTHKELYNAVDLKGKRFSRFDIEALTQYFRMHSDSRKPGSKTAVVVSAELDYGITRMISILTETFVNFEVDVFRSVDEAVAWLNE